MSARPDQYMLNLPDGMRDRLKAAAASSNRSMNAEIVARLEASGKTLRDEFAMAALTGVLANPNTSGSKDFVWETKHAAELAYRAADAMLAERQKGGA